MDYVSTVSIADDNWYGVRVVESNGGTSVIEYKDGDDGLAQTQAYSDKFPFQDSYQVSLSKQPAPNQTIRVTVQAQPTRTSETGGIVSFSQQLEVCLDSGCKTAADSSFAATQQVSFDSNNWNTPRTVWVRAFENDRVDGGDTKVFAPQLAQLNNVQGPLFVNGSVGKDRTGLLEREPVMLPGERNETPSMGNVVSSTPGAPDGSVAATVTIEHSKLGGATGIGVAAEDGTGKVQYISVNATGGTFTLSYGADTTAPLAFDAPRVAVSNALKALPGIATLLSAPNAGLSVASNGSVYQVTFRNTTSTVSVLGSDGSQLKPLTPADLIGFTVLITKGPAKNKTRIVTGAVANGANWVFTLDKAWFSPFTNDASKPDATAQYTLLKTNPNLLVKEETQANLLFMYDTDNPASYIDHGPNPFGEGRMFYDISPFGPRDENGDIPLLNQYRVTGFGMGHDRCIGGPGDALTGLCTGPVGANQPGGVTFQGIQDVELNLGAGANHFTIDDTAPGALTKINTGAGDDLVDITKISGHTIVNTGAGSDTVNVPNSDQKLSDIAGLLTLSGDSPQANVINMANGSPRQGTAVDPVDAIQQLTVDATGGTFTLTYAPQPLQLSAIAGAATGSLAAGTYYYRVSATTTLGETLASPEVFAMVGPSGSVDLAWYPVPFATGYRVYRGTMPGGENAYFASAETTVTDKGTTSMVVSPIGNGAATRSVTINSGATAADVKAALEGLALIGAGNVDVQKAGGIYRIHFQSGLRGTSIPLLLTDPTLLTNGLGTSDTLNVIDTGATTDDAAVLTSTSLTGLDMPAPNSIQQLVVDATGGTFTLDYSHWIFPTILSATPGLGGTLFAGTHYYKVTAFTAAGESIASAETSAVTADTGKVTLTWTGIAGATGYRVYRGDRPRMESAYFDVGVVTSYPDTGATWPTGPLPTDSSVVTTATTAPLAYNASAGTVQTALEGLAGVGNVVVTLNDDIYVMRFQGSLSGLPVRPPVVHPSLTRALEQLGGGVATLVSTAAMPLAVMSTRAPGYATPETNQVQLLTVDATGGTYVLSFHVNGAPFQTRPIPYNANAEQLRQAIQNAIAIGQTTDPNIRLYLAAKIDVTVDRYPSGNWYKDRNLDIYLLNFQGSLRRFNGGSGLDTLAVDGTGLAAGGTVTVTTRIDGINYYGFETVNISTGSGSEVFNVQGTTPGSNGYAQAGGIAVTNVVLNAGDDRVFVSSNADLDQPTWSAVDFLTGNIDDVRGSLNVDLGTGRHRLFMSDEASNVGDLLSITDHTTTLSTSLHLDSSAEIFVTGLTRGWDGNAAAGISYKVDPTGNLYDGVAYWTGSGIDKVYIDGTHDRPALDTSFHATKRTTTMVNTGLGDDDVTVKLT